ncbi:MAG: DUF4347 domain-containing protein, partial [Desulfobacterales bacterium]
MRKKIKRIRIKQNAKDIGVCFEPLEPRLLLSGSWGAAVDGPSSDSQLNPHGDFGSETVTLSKGPDTFGSDALLRNQHGLGVGTFVDVLASALALDVFDTASEADAVEPDTEAASSSNQTATESGESQTKISGSDTEAKNNVTEAVEKHELVFVNDNVADYERLIADLQRDDTSRNFEVVVLDSTCDGIEQVSEVLTVRSDLNGVHFITHGSDGQINLGNILLNSTNLQQHSIAISGWGNSLTENGDIIFYGCNIAADSTGQSLLNNISGLTGADVAASDDNTGHTSLSGDWEIEYQQGDIETAVAVSDQTQSTWSNVLASFGVNITSDTADADPGDGLAQDASGNTSLRAAIEQANALGGAHTITLPADTYTLSAGELVITSDITITGAGADLTIIDGNLLSRVFHTQGSVTVTITDVTIQNGDASGGGNGGALWIDDATDNVTLERVKLINNTADTGGAIYNQGGTLAIT